MTALHHGLPNGWEWRKLGDLCEILDSKRRPISQKDRIAGEYPYYGASGILDYINDYIFDEKLVLIGEDGAKWEANEKTSFIASGKYWVNNHAHIFRPCRDICIDEYLVYFLNFSDLSEYITGATVKKLNQAKLRDIDIPLPPLEEQKRIVQMLDGLFAKADKAIALLDESIASASALLPSALNEVFGELSEKYSLNEISKAIKGKVQNGLYKHRDYYNENGTKILRIDNFYNGKINTTGIKRLFLTTDEIEKYLLNENDIVINRVNSIEYLGKCAFVDKQVEPMVFESNMMKFSINEITNSMYIVYILQSSQAKEQIEKKAKRAINQCSINQTDVNTLLIPLPPLNIQTEVVAHLDAVRDKSERLSAKLRSQRDELIALKASLLERAFKGEL